MKQVLQNFKTGELTLADVPQPALKSGGVLVAVSASLISPGTEKMVVDLAQASLLGKARQRPDQVRQVIDRVRQVGPLTAYKQVMNRLDNLTPLGYSNAGTVMAVGEDVREFQVGDRVACGGGGYAGHAEVTYVPRNLVTGIPEGPGGILPFEAAAFTTLGAVALQGLRQAEPSVGECVGVIGLGTLGLLTVQLLKANGCRVLGIDPVPGRCKLAETLGCDGATVKDSEFMEYVQHWTEGKGVDAVMITAGTKSNAPIELAANACRDRGRIVAVGLVGLDVPRRLFYDKELDLRLSRSYGPGRYDPNYEERGHDYPIGYVRWTENRNMAAFLDLLAQGKLSVEPMISHRFEIEEAVKAYDLITGDERGTALGVVLRYPRAEELMEDGFDTAAVWLSDPKNAKPEVNAEGGIPRIKREHLQVGLIGAGAFAQGVLLPGLKGVKGTSLRAVCNTSGPTARHLSDKYGAAYCTSSAEDVFTDVEVDAVLIATRHDSHSALTIKALDSGKHVFVEKPLALTETELEAVMEAYARGQEGTHGPLSIMVGFNRRFAPFSLRLKAFLDEVQEPMAVDYQVNAGTIPPEHWVHDPQAGGGRIIGELCHFIDFLLFLTGAEPVSLSAQALPNLGRYQDDNVVVTIRLNDGSIGTIRYMANGDRAFPKEKITVFGGGRTAELDDFRTLKLVNNSKIKKYTSRLKQDKGHQAELDAFSRALRNGEEGPIPFRELVLTTLATFKVEGSLRSGRVVEIEKGLRERG